MEEVESDYFTQQEQNDEPQVNDRDVEDRCRSRGPVSIVTQGGNELIYSYNNVTQSLLLKICTLQEKLKEKETEVSRVKGENERLLERVHELLIGAELREEARESKERRKHNSSLHRGILKCETWDKTQPQEMKSKSEGQSYFVSWLKVSCLFGVTIGTIAYLREVYEV